MNLYHDDIMRLARDGKDGGRLCGDDVRIGQASNPLCGDDCTLSVRRQGSLLVAVQHDTRGCALCLAAAAMLCEQTQNRPVTEVQQLGEDFAAMLQAAAPPPAGWAMFTPVIERKSRQHCVLLPFEALAKALAGE